MFSNAPRCLYKKSPLADVICQLRFPDILTIADKPPAQFQEEIRCEYPIFRVLNQPAMPTNQGKTGGVNYQFATPDGVWRINLTSQFISLSCSKYTNWEDFAAHLDKPLAAFIKIYKPAFFLRIGLRYVNFFSRKTLDLENVPFSELFRPCYIGLLQEESLSESSFQRCSTDTECGIGHGCRAKIHAGPGLVKRNGQSDTEIKFIFDQDLYMPGNIAVNLSAGALHTLHTKADSIFRAAVTDILHQAMQPETIN